MFCLGNLRENASNSDAPQCHALSGSGASSFKQLCQALPRKGLIFTSAPLTCGSLKAMAYLRKISLLICFAALANLVSAAESYIIVDNQTGFILGSKNRDEKLPIASLTKVATALVVLDWARLKNSDLSVLTTVPVSAVAEGTANPVGLQPGDQMSLRDLIYSATGCFLAALFLNRVF
jgi:D-alanyl-D-alanine carboxypeptidase